MTDSTSPPASPEIVQQTGDVTLPSTRQAATRRTSSWPTDLLAASAFVALGLGLVLWPYVTGRAMPGDLQDNRLILALLEFFNRSVVAALHGRTADFLDAPFFYPWPRIVNFSDTFWGDGEMYVLIRAFRVDPFASFRAWFVAGYALTYAATFVSLRVLGLRSWGAAAGAFLFTFPLPMTNQLSHAQLVYRLWVAPAVVALDRCFTRCSLRAGAACVWFVALQLSISIYLGLFLGLLLAAYAAAMLLVGRRRLPPFRWSAFYFHSITEFASAGIILAAALAVLAIVGIPYHEVQSMYGFRRPWQTVTTVLPRIHSYLLTGQSTLWPNISYRYKYDAIWEHQIFPGLSAIIPLVWFLMSRRARERQSLAAPMIVTVAILFVVTLDLHGHTLYWLIYLLPGFSALRDLARVILIMMLPLAALFGMLIDDLVNSHSYRRPSRLIAVAMSVLLVVECSLIRQYSSSPHEWRARIQTLKARLPQTLPPHAILVVKGKPPPGVFPLAQIDAEVLAVFLGIRTMNGYSGNRPPGWRYMTNCQDIADNLRAARHFLKEARLPMPHVSPDQLVLVGFTGCDPIRIVSNPTRRSP